MLVVEVDGYQYHQKNIEQLERDRLKDSILKQINLSIVRITTNVSGERDLLEGQLKKIIQISNGLYVDDTEPETVLG